MSASDFLKKYSAIPNSFIDDLFSFYNEDSTPSDLVINLDNVAKWLNTNKKTLIQTLKSSYRQGIDFVSEKAQNPNRKDARNNNYKKVMISPECFKRLCMQSKSPKAEEVRTYFIEVETLLIKYRTGVVHELQERIAQLERNQKPKVNQQIHKSGFIYIIRASPTKDSVYKIGRTTNLSHRLSNYTSGSADDVEVVFTYETDDLEAVEGCVKSLLKEKKYRKYKEVYQADVDMIKTFIDGCAKLKMKYRNRKTDATKTGGYYVCITERCAAHQALEKVFV